jgi:hypothetical protein
MKLLPFAASVAMVLRMWGAGPASPLPPPLLDRGCCSLAWAGLCLCSLVQLGARAAAGVWLSPSCRVPIQTSLVAAVGGQQAGRLRAGGGHPT